MSKTRAVSSVCPRCRYDGPVYFCYCKKKTKKIKEQVYDGITHFEGCHDPKDPQHMGCKPNAYKTAEDIAIEILASLEGPTQRQGMMAYIAQALRDFAAGELEEHGVSCDTLKGCDCDKRASVRAKWLREGK